LDDVRHRKEDEWIDDMVGLRSDRKNYEQVHDRRGRKERRAEHGVGLCDEEEERGKEKGEAVWEEEEEDNGDKENGSGVGD
jgi:hypothetical protein